MFGHAVSRLSVVPANRGRRPRALETRALLRVVVTGGSKGLGLALASEFIKNGDSVVVTSRDAERVNQAVSLLRANCADGFVVGVPADIRRTQDVDALTSFAMESMGGVDVWINNAGSNGYSYTPLMDTDPTLLEEVVLTNTLGTLLCCRSAIAAMLTQKTGGHIFNMEGAGSDGAATRLFSAYGMTKAGVPQLTKSLSAETKDTPVRVHSISPGMVFTELLSSGRYSFGQQGRFFVNAIAQPPEDAAAQIVPQVRAVALAPPSDASSAIKVLTPQVAVTRLAKRLVFGENKDRYYKEKDDEPKPSSATRA